MTQLLRFTLLVIIMTSCQIKRDTKTTIDMTVFDIDKLTEFAISEIKNFADSHPDEKFYGFSIDANLLCMNSIEEFEKSLKNYQERWGGYDTDEKIQGLKLNTGDWEYRGFSEFNDSVGFNMESYLDHYHSDEEEQVDSDYAKAMDEVVDRLKKSDAFDKLNKTKDFFVNRVEHDY